MKLYSLKPEQRPRFFTLLLVAAEVSLVLSILLPRLAPAWFASDFLSGLLLGFSLVGNVAYLVYFGSTMRSKLEGRTR